MAGLRIPDTPVAVDYWNIKQLPANCLFFLTHAHSDHLNGLSSSWSRPIYCTAITAKLVGLRRHVRPSLIVSNPLHMIFCKVAETLQYCVLLQHTCLPSEMQVQSDKVELEYDQSTIVHADGHGGRVPITVTAIDAHHCPGSAMFLFEGYFGAILHTGDFRLRPLLLHHDLLSGRKAIDVVYIDNTYCHPSCEFPSREDAGLEVVKLVQSVMADHEVFIGVPLFGKEDLLVMVARQCRVWLSVSPNRMEILRVLQLPNVFTTDRDVTRVHVVLINEITPHRVDKWINQYSKVSVIMPTSRHCGVGSLPFNAHPDITIIPYSDHCSFSELKCFVKSVHPHCVRPNVSSCHGNMDYFSDLLDHTPSEEYTIPQPLKTMLTCSGSCDQATSMPKRGRKRYSSIPSLPKRRSQGVEFDDQPCPSNALVDPCNQSHPSSPHSDTVELYFQLARDHKSKTDGWGSASHDAWSMALDYFANQPHPQIHTNDWIQLLC